MLGDPAGQAGAAVHPLLGLPERVPCLRAHRRARLRLDLPGPDRRHPHPQLEGIEAAASLPFASSLCGACYEVCPVKIDIPRVLVHLRGLAPKARGERRAMRTLAWVFRDRRRYQRAQRLARALPRRVAGSGPAAGWTHSRELPDGRAAELPGVVA